jgi:hypothetical protein
MKMRDWKTTVCQWVIDFCERRSLRANNIKQEIFWDKLSGWFLNL